MSRQLIPNSTQVPDVILDEWMARLSASEFKVVMYVVRKTYGWGKERDAISIRQMVQGHARRDGAKIDHGTGLNERTVLKACQDLVDRGVLTKTRHTDERGGHAASTYALKLDWLPNPEDSEENPPQEEPESGEGDPTRKSAGGGVNPIHPLPVKVQEGVPALLREPLPALLQDTRNKERNKEQETRTLNVGDAAHGGLFGAAAPPTPNDSGPSLKGDSRRGRRPPQDSAVAKVVDLTGDARSVRRFRQLLDLAWGAGCHAQWDAAVRATEKKVRSPEPPHRPGAYFGAILAGLLLEAGVSVPVGAAEEREDVRRQIRESLGLT